MKHLLLSMASMLLFLQASLAQSTSPKESAAKETSEAVSISLKTVSGLQAAEVQHVVPSRSLIQQPVSATSMRGCDGVDKKLINGVCETGQIIYSRSEWNNTTHEWKCYYYYRWSDGSTSAEYYFVNSAGCP